MANISATTLQDAMAQIAREDNIAVSVLDLIEELESSRDDVSKADRDLSDLYHLVYGTSW